MASFLLIILGFSQVLGRNYGSLTESKSEREVHEYDNSMDYFNARSGQVRIENKNKMIEMEEKVNLEYSEAAPSEFATKPKRSDTKRNKTKKRKTKKRMTLGKNKFIFVGNPLIHAKNKKNNKKMKTRG